MRPPLSERAYGRWRGILPAAGIPSASLSGKHTACPMCGGKDRFRFDDKAGKGTWICSHCGAGDGISLVMKFCKLEFRDAAKLIEPHLDALPVEQFPQGISDEKRRKMLVDLWTASHRIGQEDAAYRYLVSRCGLIEIPSSLRAIDRLKYVDNGKADFFAGMLATVSAPDGKAVTMHRTFLTKDGRKAPVDNPRRIMPGSIAFGSAVRLADHDETLGIAEGIETALSASKLFNVPVWAALNAGLLAKWEPPAGVKSILIFGDNDASFTGQKAAYELAFRLSDKFQTTVHLPRQTGTDWNDVLVDQSRRAA